MKHNEKMLYQATDEILFYLWDPIGVKDIPAARDEYRSYLPGVFKLLLADAKDSEIAKYLTKVESTSMGLSESPQHALDIARTLIEAKDWYFE